MRCIELAVGGRAVYVHLPKSGGVKNAVYTVSDKEQAKAVQELMRDGSALVTISADWERELSPWPASRAFSGTPDFAGEADAFLDEMEKSILPAAEEVTGAPERRVIAGYSLAGLFSLYAAVKTRLFCAAASVSGSLWYDGFTDWLKSRDIAACGMERAYLSLGDRERFSRDRRIAAVGDCTRITAELFAAAGVNTVFCFEPGGHFSDPAGRLSRGINALI